MKSIYTATSLPRYFYSLRGYPNKFEFIPRIFTAHTQLWYFALGLFLFPRKVNPVFSNLIELSIIDPSLFAGEGAQAVANTFVGGLGILVAGLMSSAFAPTLLVMSAM